MFYWTVFFQQTAWAFTRADTEELFDAGLVKGAVPHPAAARPSPVFSSVFAPLGPPQRLAAGWDCSAVLAP